MGEGPTTSEAISSASSSELAGENPSRRTALGSPPTTMTRPRCSQRVGAPVPHVEGVHAVVGVAGAVEVHVPRVGGEGLLELLVHPHRVDGLGQHLLVEVDVARVVAGVELGPGRVPHDHDAALAHQRPAPVHVEEVAQPEAGHQDRVHDGVHVVGADVGQPHGQDVGLPLDVDALLGPDVRRRHARGPPRPRPPAPRSGRAGSGWSGRSGGPAAAASWPARPTWRRRWRGPAAPTPTRASGGTAKLDGKVSLLSVVSIWKTFTPDSAMSRPMRQFDECSSDDGAGP